MSYTALYRKFRPENFKDVKNTCTEKLKMLKKESGIYFINGDSPCLAEAAENLQKKVIQFGINGAFEYRCENIFSNDLSLSSPSSSDQCFLT